MDAQQPTAVVHPLPSPTATDDGAPSSRQQMEEGGLQEGIKELSKEYVISIGMKFESEDHAYSFYNDYGKLMGFGIRKDYITKSQVTGDERYLQDEEFFEWFRDPKQSQ
ncbi:hypothetical protein Vadar_003736 [Vaccinium darrowii]|uniref:Uncharacterized protein n=1 Tax=Vaccinium darrowii TaxID=229202 RepID=A0ACB7Y631_9ERIC|nr:hypothetical protein Vadar_003736 [Vaccinium darrowii]